MTLEELKHNIELNQELLPTIIMVCKDETSEFIFHQYLNQYARNNDLNCEFINDISELSNNNLFATPTNIIKLWFTNKLENIVIPKNQKLWVRCKSINKDLLNDYNFCVVEVPKLENWHIKDYVYSLLPNVPKSDLDNLISAHKNIYDIDNEINKLKCFSQPEIAYPLIKNQLYVETSEYAIFDVINALIKYDKKSLCDILLNIEYINIDVFGFITLLLNNFNRIINVQLSKNINIESLGISEKQLWAIKKFSCNIYTKNQLLEIYKLLTSCDYMIKSGYIPSNIMIPYLIFNIMTIKERIS